MLCYGCPLRDAECETFRRSLKGQYVGVLAGKVQDFWGDQTFDWEGEADDAS